MNCNNLSNYDNYTYVYKNNIKPAEAQYKFKNIEPKMKQFDELGVKGMYNFPSSISNTTFPGDSGCQNGLAEMFFSKENMKRIQKKIKDEIFKRTKGKYRMNRIKMKQN